MISPIPFCSVSAQRSYLTARSFPTGQASSCVPVKPGFAGEEMPQAYGPLGRKAPGLLISGQEPAKHIGATFEATAGVATPEIRANPIIDIPIKAPFKNFFIFFSFFSNSVSVSAFTFRSYPS